MCPSPLPRLTPSYSCCATAMVWRTEKPSLRAPSCCNVDVVNGGGGVFFSSFSSMDFTVYDAYFKSASTCFDSLSEDVTNFSPSFLLSDATNSSFFSVSKEASTVQYSTGLKARISRSRSTMIFTATDCTRPADRPRYTFFQRNGESV